MLIQYKFLHTVDIFVSILLIEYKYPVLQNPFLFDEQYVRPICKCKLHANVIQKLPTLPKENTVYRRLVKL